MWHVSLLQVYCWKQVQTAYSFSRSSRYLFCSGYVHIYLPKYNRRLVAGANILIDSLKGVERNGKEFGLELIHPSVLSSSAVIPLKSLPGEKKGQIKILQTSILIP